MVPESTDTIWKAPYEAEIAAVAGSSPWKSTSWKARWSTPAWNVRANSPNSTNVPLHTPQPGRRRPISRARVITAGHSRILPARKALYDAKMSAGWFLYAASWSGKKKGNRIRKSTPVSKSAGARISATPPAQRPGNQNSFFSSFFKSVSCKVSAKLMKSLP